MKKWTLAWATLSLLFVFNKPDAQNEGPKSTSIIQTGRAISLRVLQKRLEACEPKGTCPKEIVHLAGIRRVLGYLIDGRNHDIVLIGRVDASLPALHLEDFVVALRNAWLKYAELKGNTYYYSNPGCSIDPSPQVMRRLQEIGQEILASSSDSEVEKHIQRWHRIGRSAQKVRVLGVPFHTRFAWVMVKADYDMKKLVDGSDSLDIAGFASLTDMTLEKAKSDILSGRAVSIPLSSVNRFWFYPGTNIYVEDEGIVLMRRCQVVLLTEEEFVSKTGKVSGKGHPDQLAQAFAEKLTDCYDKVAQKRPVYTKLEDLFRFVALAKILKFKSVPKDAGLDLGYLLDHYRVPKTRVKENLPGRTNVKEFKHRWDVAGGYQIAQLWLPSCGGVGIEIEVGRQSFERDTTAMLHELRDDILKARPSPKTLSWNFDLRGKVRLDQKNIRTYPFVFPWPTDKRHPNI